MSGKIYTAADFAPIIEGAMPLPNTEEVDGLHFLNDLAAVGHGWTPKWGYSRVGDDRRWTQYFLFIGGGEGYAVRYGSSWPTPKPCVLSFALCRHEMVATGSREQSRRGWNPGHCKLCGLDMSVDSSD